MVNIGSEEMLSIDGLAQMIMGIDGKRLRLRHVPGPQGVRGRRSDKLIGWLGRRPRRWKKVCAEPTPGSRPKSRSRARKAC